MNTENPLGQPLTPKDAALRVSVISQKITMCWQDDPTSQKDALQELYQELHDLVPYTPLTPTGKNKLQTLLVMKIQNPISQHYHSTAFALFSIGSASELGIFGREKAQEYELGGMSDMAKEIRELFDAKSLLNPDASEGERTRYARDEQQLRTVLAKWIDEYNDVYHENDISVAAVYGGEVNKRTTVERHVALELQKLFFKKERHQKLPNVFIETQYQADLQEQIAKYEALSLLLTARRHISQ